MRVRVKKIQRKSIFHLKEYTSDFLEFSSEQVDTRNIFFSFAVIYEENNEMMIALLYYYFEVLKNNMLKHSQFFYAFASTTATTFFTYQKCSSSCAQDKFPARAVH